MREKRGVWNYGGRDTKWDRLHPREVDEIQLAIKTALATPSRELDFSRLLGVLNGWAAYRYHVARSHCPACLHPRLRGSGRVERMPGGPENLYPSLALPPEPVAPEPVAPPVVKKEAWEEEKLPWE